MHASNRVSTFSSIFPPERGRSASRSIDKAHADASKASVLFAKYVREDTRGKRRPFFNPFLGLCSSSSSLSFLFSQARKKDSSTAATASWSAFTATTHQARGTAPLSLSLSLSVRAYDEVGQAAVHGEVFVNVGVDAVVVAAGHCGVLRH